MGDDVDRPRESVHSAAGEVDGVDSALRASRSSVVGLDDVDVTVHIDGLAPAAAGAA